MKVLSSPLQLISYKASFISTILCLHASATSCQCATKRNKNKVLITNSDTSEAERVEIASDNTAHQSVGILKLIQWHQLPCQL